MSWHWPSARRRPIPAWTFIHDLSEHGLHVAAANTGEDLIDPEAKAAYRQRLAELHSELEDARRSNDPARTARTEHEVDALTRELSAVTGLRGRTRRTPSSADRARVNVTKSIRAAIARIAEVSPALGAHLSSAIRTGTACSYFPDPGSTVSWQL